MHSPTGPLHLASTVRVQARKLSNAILQKARRRQLINEHKRTQKARGENEDWQRVLFDHSPDAYLIIVEGVFVDCNQTAADLLQSERGQIIGRSPASLSPEFQPDGRSSCEAANQRIDHALRSGENTFEWAHRRMDGSDVMVEVRIARMMMDGQPALFSTWRDITHRKQAERKLQESEQRLQFVLQGGGLGFWDCDLETDEVHRNQRWAEMLGHAPGEIDVDRVRWNELVHPDDLPMAWQSIKDHIAGRTPMHVHEYRLRTKSGDYKWILDHAKVVAWDANGKPTRMSGIHADVTERRHLYEVLRESEHLLKEAQVVAGQGSYVLNIPAGIWRSSDALDHIFGIQPSHDRSVAGWSALIHRDDRAMMEDYFRCDVLDQHHRFDREYRIVRHSDQTVRWVHGLGQLELDAGGQPLKMIGTIQDITRRKQAEEKLQSQQAAIEQSANAIVMTDPSGIIEYVNPAFERTSGFPSDEVIGQHTRILKSGRQQVEFYSNLWKTITEGKIWRGQFHNQHRDGTLYWESATISPVRNDHGEIIRFIAIKEDISAIKELELKLRDAFERAERATHAKSEFLANMSHEIRTPINGILGMTDLLLDTKQTPEQREFAESIHSCSESLLAIINDILDFSKVEAGQLTLETLDFNLRETIAETLEILSGIARQKGLDLSCVIADQVPEILRGDPGRLRQILLNLIGNAIKFTDTGSVAVQVGLTVETAVSASLHFSVTDTGNGIPKSKQETIFSKFTQADPSTTRQFGGTGLGLAICRQLVHLFHGEIRVTSEVGKGATFSFTATFQKPPAGALRPPREENAPLPATASVAAIRCHKRLRVLVAEDNTTNRIIAVKMLERLGHLAEAVANGEEAVDSIRRLPYDLVLMDCQMPMMDGFEATRIIRNFDPEALNSQIPIIALTAHAMKGDRELCLAAGMTDYVSKPTNVHELASAIERCFG